MESSTLICIICSPTVEAPGLIMEVTANNRRSKDEVVGRPLRILHGFNHGVSSLSNTLLRVGFISQGSFNVCWCAPMDKAPCNATFRLGRRDDAPSASLIIPRSFISKNHLFLPTHPHLEPIIGSFMSCRSIHCHSRRNKAQ